MNKQNYLKELEDIQTLSSKLRNHKLNESVMFEDDLDNFQTPEGEEMPQEQPIDEPQQAEPQPEPEIETGLEGKGDVKDAASPEEKGMEELDNMGEVDKIREITLRGMTKLCKTPEAPEFQALLKIFQICNKSVSKDEIEENK